MTPPLLAPSWRRRAALAIAAGLAVFLVLAGLVFHSASNPVDRWVFRELPRHISNSHAQFLLQFTDPALSVVLLAFTAVFALATGRWRLAVLAAGGPAIATALASDVLKPLIHRTLFDGTVGSFPSGHETGVTSTATVLLIAFAQVPLRRAGRIALSALLGVWVVVAAVGLTRFYYHYATDTLGAMGWALACVLGLALLLDRVGRRDPAPRRPPAGSDARPSAGPARPRPRPVREPADVS